MSYISLNITKALIIWTEAFYLKKHCLKDFGDAGIIF